MCSKVSESPRRPFILLSGVFAVMLALVAGAQAQLLSEGPNNPTTVVNDPCTLNATWFPTGNAVSSNDSYAEVSPAGSPTQCLKATGYAFAIPSPAEIKGIEVFVERHSSGGTLVDSSLKIVKGGVITGTEHADAINPWPMTTDAVATYGSTSDLWGTTWTPADVNGAGFGVALSAFDSGNTASVDVMQITVHYSLCAAVPASGCFTALKSVLVIKDKGVDNAKDKMIWKWIKGQPTMQGNFANPLATATYALCVYDGPTETLIAQAVVPPDATKWTLISTKGYKYKDKTGVEDGITKIILKANTTSDKSKAIVKGKGVPLPDIVPPLITPVKVNLVNSDTGDCFTSSFAAGDPNIAGKFKAKTP